MVVDDDPLLVSSTAAMLEDLGHLVIEAMSGARALDMLRLGAKVDVVGDRSCHAWHDEAARWFSARDSDRWCQAYFMRSSPILTGGRRVQRPRITL